VSLKIWIINFFLVLGVIFLGLKAYGVWSEGKKSPLGISAMKAALPQTEKKTAKKGMPPESEYKIIVDNSLFWSDRSAQRPKNQQMKKAQSMNVKSADKRLLNKLKAAHKLTQLYGVVIVGDHKEALITEISGNTRKKINDRGIKRVKVGDTVGMFKVKEIKDTNVLLTGGGREWPIALFDKNKPKKRASKKKDGGPIVIVGGSKTGSIVKEAKVVEKRRTPKPAVSRKKALPKAQNKRRTIPVPTNRSKTKKR